MNATGSSSSIVENQPIKTTPEDFDSPPLRKIKNVTVKQKEQTSDRTIAVHTLIPRPSQTLVDDHQVAHYDAKLIKRVTTLSSFINKEAHIYALGKILSSATWGRYQPMKDHRSQLCNPVTNEPIQIWTVGHVASSWFQRNGEPERYASLTVIPLSESVGRQTMRLLNGLATPPIEVIDDSAYSVRAIKWQSLKGSDEPVLFNAAYDARELLLAKKKMESYPITEIKKDDLVLLETKMTRYPVKNSDNKWGDYRTQMELLAVSLLHSANHIKPVKNETTHDIVGLRI
ncbi:hypothetical protein L210DRAFT_867482 [Boletus edulis BED1]|uniref:Uncharacterized protein n=1 Tax=Boletus edulis BED1 TaxID=1328754 RepID=A0AAD4BUH3_BOLED|nr:hypothetical protein L210DRAFT_867482 [Boletus edulis BED1]